MDNSVENEVLNCVITAMQALGAKYLHYETH